MFIEGFFLKLDIHKDILQTKNSIRNEAKNIIPFQKTGMIVNRRLTYLKTPTPTTTADNMSVCQFCALFST